MSTTTTADITFSYSDGTTREYSLGEVPSTLSATAFESNVRSFNSTVSADDSVRSFYVSDDGEPMVKIVEAKITTEEVTLLT